MISYKKIAEKLRCDECGTIVKFATEDEWKALEAGWKAYWVNHVDKQLCPECLKRRQEQKAELVADAARKPVRDFLQVDGWFLGGPNGGDDVMQPDEDGDCLMAGGTRDLRNSDSDLAVRVQIVAGADRDVVLRVLKKLRRWLKKDWDELAKRWEQTPRGIEINNEIPF